MNWAAWSNLAQACQKVSPLWCLAVLAVTAFGLSSLFALTAAKGVADFAFAAVSVATASAVQKLAVLVLHSALFCRKRFRSAIVVEFLFR
jgi:predicted transcriptional regulator